MFIICPQNTQNKQNASQTSAMMLKIAGGTWHVGLLTIRRASVCSAVVIASRGAKDLMRKLQALGKILSKKQEVER